MPSEVPPEIRQEWARLRQIMYEPSAVWLATEYSGDRWLTDQFVLYLVSDCESFRGLPDGPYKLTAGNGPRSREGVPEPDLEAYFAALDGSLWLPAEPTEWSVAEHPGKAMLWVYGGSYPCLIGEPTWTQINRHHPGATVEYSPTRNLFRFSGTPSDCASCNGVEGVYCGHRPVPFAFAAGIRIPDGQEGIAEAIAHAFDTTSHPVVLSDASN